MVPNESFMQVFPLLIDKFSFREQASLVWQFICSVPVMVLEDFLPWMMYYLSHEEKIEVENCIKDVAPAEDSMQQVYISPLLRYAMFFFFHIHHFDKIEFSEGHKLLAS